jgi:hypothetical protein
MTNEQVRYPHDFDDDCVCHRCGFDAAEWHWLNVTNVPFHERERKPMPSCRPSTDSHRRHP